MTGRDRLFYKDQADGISLVIKACKARGGAAPSYLARLYDAKAEALRLCGDSGRAREARQQAEKLRAS